MTLEEYQKEIQKYAKYPKGVGIAYLVLGLNGEAGEVAEVIKKAIRDDGSSLTKGKAFSLMLEVGDVLWYLTQLCTELGWDLEDVAQLNLDKLYNRHS